MRGPFEFLAEAACTQCGHAKAHHVPYCDGPDVECNCASYETDREEQFRRSIESIGDAGLTRLANDIFPPKDPLAKYERAVVALRVSDADATALRLRGLDLKLCPTCDSWFVRPAGTLARYCEVCFRRALVRS